MPRLTPPDVDRVAASRAAVAARRARAAVKASIASRVLSPLDVAEGAWPTRHRPRHGCGYASSSPASRRRPGPGGRIMERPRDRGRRNASAGSGPCNGGGCAIGSPSASTGHHAGRHRAWSCWPDRPPWGRGRCPRTSANTIRRPVVRLGHDPPAPARGRWTAINYFFVDDAEFDRMIAAGDMLEWATVHNAYRYGTPRAPIDAALADGKSVLLEIDLQGARSVKHAMPEATLVFLLPPSWEELVRRLIGRGTEDSAEQASATGDREGGTGGPERVRLPRGEPRRAGRRARSRRLDDRYCPSLRRSPLEGVPNTW